MWLYHCFGPSLREVETILAERGIIVSHESVRAWSLRFGRAFANALEKRRPRPGDKWRLDEVLIRIGGKLHYLWRAVDQHGTVLDVLVQSRRSAKAAKRFLKNAVTAGGVGVERHGRHPEVMEGAAPLRHPDRSVQQGAHEGRLVGLAAALGPFADG